MPSPGAVMACACMALANSAPSTCTPQFRERSCHRAFARCVHSFATIYPRVRIFPWETVAR
jgi:hypothetical protein